MPAFDPYHKWLGIPPAEQPPSHYRLLGISQQEDDGDVIAAAADQRMDYLHQFAQSERGPDAQRVMDEIARASMCLLDPVRRAAYDATLRSQAAPMTPPQFSSAPKAMYSRPVPPLDIDDADSTFKPRGKDRARLYFWLWNGALLVGIVVLAVVIGMRRQQVNQGDDVADNDSPPTGDANVDDHADGSFLTESNDAAVDDTTQTGNASDPVATTPVNPRRVEGPPAGTQPRPSRPEPAPMIPADAVSEFPIEPPDDAILSLQPDEPAAEVTLPPGLIVPADAATVRQAQEQWAAAIGFELEAVNTIEMPLVLVPPGEFEMGAWSGNDRTAQTQQVSISQPFYVGRREVTQQEWRKVLGDDAEPSHYSYRGEGSAAVQGLGTSRFPVESITWFDAIQFCNALSRLEMLDEYYLFDSGNDADASSINVSIAGGTGYRLPTEAEWEYACRAGTMTAFHFGELDAVTADSFQSSLASVSRTTEVESYPANAFGLCDMHGNAWEWCYDWFDQFQADNGAPLIDPIGPQASIYSSRLIRGGSYVSEPDRCMSISRAYALPDEARRDIGLRVARTLDALSDRLATEPAIAVGTADAPTNLLEAVHPELHSDSRPWERTDAGIVADNFSGASFLTVPGFVPEEYDLQIQLTIEREESDPGSDIHISLPQSRGARGRRTAFPFVIRRIGSDTLLSFWPSDPTTGEFGVAPLGVTLVGENAFAAGATILFRVRAQSITVLLDDEEQFVFHNFGRAITSEIPLLKLGSWQNRVVFHSAVLTPFERPEN